MYPRINYNTYFTLSSLSCRLVFGWMFSSISCHLRGTPLSHTSLFIEFVKIFFSRLQDLHICFIFILKILLVTWFSYLLMTCPCHYNLLFIFVTGAIFRLPLIYSLRILCIIVTLTHPSQHYTHYILIFS